MHCAVSLQRIAYAEHCPAAPPEPEPEPPLPALTRAASTDVSGSGAWLLLLVVLAVGALSAGFCWRRRQAKRAARSVYSTLYALATHWLGTHTRSLALCQQGFL